jgi:hypothetical protein
MKVNEMPGVDLSDLMGGEGVPSDQDMRGTVDDNNAESDAGSQDIPQGALELIEKPGAGDLDVSGDGDDDDSANPKGRKQLVPLGALQEERNKRQELQQQVQEQQRAQQQLADRLTRLLEAQQLAQNPPPEPEVIPDFDEDPRGHVEGLKRQFSQQLEEMRQFMSGQQQTNQQAQFFQQIQSRVAVDEQTYRQVAPDYDQAAKFFNDRKLAEYGALGLDPVAARQQLAKDVLGIAQIAYQQGKNPAELLHGLAKAFGHVAKPGDAPGAQPPADNGWYPPNVGGGNGGQSGAPAAKQPNTSLSSLEGAARAPDEKGKLTALQVAEMSDKDFDALWADMAKKGNSNSRIKI